MSDLPDRRKGGIRRDINSLFRGPDGEISGSKLGTYVGQYLAGRALYLNIDELIDHWDSLAILLTALMLPEILKRIMLMRIGGGSSETRETSKETSKVTVTGATT